jgi:hypothetical protein
MQTIILFKVLVGFLIVLFEFLDDIGAYIREVFFDSFSHTQRIFGRNACFTTFSKELLHKRSDITTSNRNTLDGAADNIAFSLSCK